MNTRIGADPSAQRAAFDALLARLRRDGDAGLGYEALRRRLLQLFRLHSPAEAGALADVTLDRLARKIGEGTEIDNVPLYTLGIARMVLHEANAHAAQWHMVDTDPASIAATDESGRITSANPAFEALFGPGSGGLA